MLSLRILSQAMLRWQTQVVNSNHQSTYSNAVPDGGVEVLQEFEVGK